MTVILAGEARDKKDAIYYHPNGQVIAGKHTTYSNILGIKLNLILGNN